MFSLFNRPSNISKKPTPFVFDDGDCETFGEQEDKTVQDTNQVSIPEAIIADSADFSLTQKREQDRQEEPQNLPLNPVIETAVSTISVFHPPKASAKKRLWESHHPVKLPKPVYDAAGNEYDIRKVNHNTQLAIWDGVQNKQILVHKKNKHNEVCFDSSFGELTYACEKTNATPVGQYK